MPGFFGYEATIEYGEGVRFGGLPDGVRR